MSLPQASQNADRLRDTQFGFYNSKSPKKVEPYVSIEKAKGTTNRADETDAAKSQIEYNDYEE